MSFLRFPDVKMSQTEKTSYWCHQISKWDHNSTKEHHTLPPGELLSYETQFFSIVYILIGVLCQNPIFIPHSLKMNNASLAPPSTTSFNRYSPTCVNDHLSTWLEDNLRFLQWRNTILITCEQRPSVHWDQRTVKILPKCTFLPWTKITLSKLQWQTWPVRLLNACGHPWMSIIYYNWQFSVPLYLWMFFVPDTAGLLIKAGIWEPLTDTV